jgi:hypothetical protein
LWATEGAKTFRCALTGAWPARKPKPEKIPNKPSP